MQSFEYTYNSPEIIFENIKLIKDFSSFEIISLFFLLLIIFLMIYYIIPFGYILSEYSEEKKVKKKRNLIIKKLILQKEIEDSILKEVDETIK